MVGGRWYILIFLLPFLGFALVFVSLYFSWIFLGFSRFSFLLLLLVFFFITLLFSLGSLIYFFLVFLFFSWLYLRDVFSNMFFFIFKF